MTQHGTHHRTHSLHDAHAQPTSHEGHLDAPASPGTMPGHDMPTHEAAAHEMAGAGAAHDHAAMMSDPRMAARMEREMRNRFLVSLA